MRHVLASLLVLCGGVRAAWAEPLADLLAAVAAGARFEQPTRADVRIECEAGCEGARAVVLGRGETVYVEVRGGVRALISPTEVRTAAGETGVAAAARRLAGSDVLVEDLAVFRPAQLAFPQISDDGPDGVVVTSAPAGSSAYALLVLTIERERRAIVKTQYYTGTVSNLAKVRRDRRLVQVGGRWRPAEITVETFHPPATSRLVLDWREWQAAPAALFDPEGLRQPSGLAFD